jgi:hypothetical protein
MLRITELNEKTSGRTLRLEGKLLGPWVEELRKACTPNGPATRVAHLDIAAVSYVDAPGARLLRELMQRGVILAPCSRYLAELLHVEKP